MLQPWRFTVVVRGEQFPLLMSKLQRALPDESTAVDGYIAWDIDDKFQVQRAVLPLSLRSRLPSTSQMAEAPKDSANAIGTVVSELWEGVGKKEVSSSVLLSRFMVPVGVLRRLATDTPQGIVPADLGEEVQAAAAAAAEGGGGDDDSPGPLQTAVPVAAPPAPAHGKQLEEVKNRLAQLHAQYNDAIAEQMRDSTVRQRLQDTIAARDSKIVQLERGTVDMQQQVAAANSRAAALEIDGAGASGDEGSPRAGGLRKRGGGGGIDDVAAGGGEGDAAGGGGGFALWQLALVAVVMFLVGRLV
jgi:hypothetical protein